MKLSGMQYELGCRVNRSYSKQTLLVEEVLLMGSWHTAFIRHASKLYMSQVAAPSSSSPSTTASLVSAKPNRRKRGRRLTQPQPEKSPLLLKHLLISLHLDERSAHLPGSRWQRPDRHRCQLPAFASLHPTCPVSGVRPRQAGR